MDSQRRLLLALALSFVVTTVYVLFLAPGPEAEEAPLPISRVSAVDAGQASPPPVAPPPDSEAPPTVEGGTAEAVAETTAPLQELRRERSAVDYRFSSSGASMVSATLKASKTREQQQVKLLEGWARLFGKKSTPPPQMDLARPPRGSPAPLSLSIQGADALPADARYSVEEATDRRLVMKLRQAGWEVTKRFEWVESGGYELLMSVTVKNLSASTRNGELLLHFTREVDPGSEEAPSFFGGVGNEASAICGMGDEIHKKSPSNDSASEEPGAVRFFGVDHQYFLSALFPLERAPQGKCGMMATPEQRVATAALPLSLRSGEARVERFGVYLGPKDVDALAQVPSEGLLQLARVSKGLALQPQLERSVDFGFWAVICKVLLGTLKLFQRTVQNWGVAIVLLTLVVKVVLLPLTHRSMVGMESMKKLQPKIDVIRAKFPDDRERQQQEMMKLYRDEKVNPFGSCLLMLVQMPVWLALYTTLRSSYELYNEPFMFWSDLTYKDPTYLLPILLGITMVVTAKLQPPTADPAQARMLTYVMPVFFTLVLLSTPAGLTLYMVTNNVLSIGQTYALRRWMANKDARK